MTAVVIRVNEPKIMNSIATVIEAHPKIEIRASSVSRFKLSPLNAGNTLSEFYNNDYIQTQKNYQEDPNDECRP